MSDITTCAVKAIVHESEGGIPAVGATIDIQLSYYDIDSGFVAPEKVSFKTDENGEVVMDLWPNQLGQSASYYEVKIKYKNKTFRSIAVVPDVPTAFLHEITDIPPYDGQPTGAIILARIEELFTLAEKMIPKFLPNAPLNPIPGARWTDADTGKTYEWIVTASSSAWFETGSAETIGYETAIQAAQSAVAAANSAAEAQSSEDDARATLAVFAAAPPANPFAGRRWTNSNTGKTYEWIVDADGGQWVEFGPAQSLAANPVMDALLLGSGFNKVGYDPTLGLMPDTLGAALYREKTKYLTDKPFLADATGVATSGAKIKAAIESLQDGETLVAIGTYRIAAGENQSINVPSNVTIDFSRATLVFEALANLDLNGGSGGQLATGALSAPGTRMAEWIDVVDGTMFQENDLVVPLDPTQWFDLGNTYRTSEANSVREVIGNRVYLDGPLLCDYATGSSVARYRTSSNVTLKLGRINNKGALPASDGVSIRLRFMVNPRVFAPRTVNSQRFALYVMYCSGDIIFNPVSMRPGTVAAEAGYLGEYGYGISHAFSCFSRVVNGGGGRGWHVYEAATGQRDITYQNCMANMDGFSFSTHEGCVSVRYENCQGIGKLGITCRARYLEVFGGKFEVTRGQGVAVSANCMHWVVDGVLFRGLSSTASSVYSDNTQGAGRAGLGLDITGIVRNCTFDGIHRVVMGGQAYNLDHCVFEKNTIVRRSAVDDSGADLSAQKSISHKDNTYINAYGSFVASLRVLAGGRSVSKNNQFLGVRYGGFLDLYRVIGAGDFYFDGDHNAITGTRYYIRNLSGAAVNIPVIENLRTTQITALIDSSTAGNSVTVGLMRNNHFATGQTIAIMTSTNVTFSKQVNDYFAQYGTTVNKGLPTASAGLPSGAVYTNAGVLTVVP